MIRSFGSKETERLWRRERVRSIDPRIHRVAPRKLRQVGSAEALDDLRTPPEEFWINLQSHYELDRAEDLAGEQIASITPLSVA